jgi:hypothetical protein
MLISIQNNKILNLISILLKINVLPKYQSKMDIPKKVATHGTQYEEKHNRTVASEFIALSLLVGIC